jgi:hypothetical protein
MMLLRLVEARASAKTVAKLKLYGEMIMLEQFVASEQSAALEQSTALEQSATSEQRQAQYFNLIDRLLKCPSGEEPAVLDSQPDLLDAGLVKSLMQVAMMVAHQDNPDAAKFLTFLARQLSQALGLYDVDQNA